MKESSRNEDTKNQILKLLNGALKNESKTPWEVIIKNKINLI